MRNLLLLSLLVVGLMSCQEDETCTAEVYKISVANVVAEDSPQILSRGMVTICHYDDTTGESTTMEVPQQAVEGHLNHGDSEGECVVLSNNGLEYEVTEVNCDLVGTTQDGYKYVAK